MPVTGGRERIERRLAAIFAADVAGYSHLMGQDEVGTLRTLTAHREVMDGLIAEHGGRIANTAGDSVLAEFPSAVDAVQCAVEVQKAFADLFGDEGPERPLRFRIGIHVGDVMVQGGDLLGDRVNIAARLQSLAEPGGICISGDVYQHVRKSLPYAFTDLGHQKVKNVDEPVHTYAFLTEGRSALNSVNSATVSQKLSPSTRPSIAVMPFTNLSGDQADQYFADGITEDLITALSRIRWFRVVARSSAFGYKPPPTRDTRQIAHDLGARYLLEGSVRKAGDRVRLTAQLIDGETTHQIWTKRYDRDTADIFAMQDDLTESLIASVEPELDKAERERARAKRPENLNAWDLYQRGVWHLHKRSNDDLIEAERLFQQALDSDPGLVPALCAATEVHVLRVLFGFADDPGYHRAQALRLARSAVELDDQDARAQCTMGRAYSANRDHQAAIPYLKTAINLNPSSAWAHYLLGVALTYSGRANEAIPHLHLAIKQNPHDPYVSRFMACLAEAQMFLGQDEQAVEWAQQSLRQHTAVHYTGHTVLAAALGHLGRVEEAQKVLHALHVQWPHFSLALMVRSFSLNHPEFWARYLDGLNRAGLTQNSGT
jgi:adenylate cyclase